MRVLVTGGTGTFGRAFIGRALRTGQWHGVVSYSRDEMKAAQLVHDFGGAAPFKAFLGDVRDRSRLAHAFRGVDVVVHAAALKRVDVGAYSPSELIATNILGTQNVVDAAIDARVKRVIVISSDKACMPTNLYGATKMCAETYAVQANAYGFPVGTRIAAVRYGNILGSRGSVVHVWRDQLKRRAPLTITDVSMTRFIMTIEQAVDLVLYALQAMRGGEVFVPRLPAAAMPSLALAVMHDAGVDNVRDYPKKYTGLRPGGEKLHEALLNHEEVSRTVESGQHLLVAPTHHEWTAEPWLGTAYGADEYTSDRAGQFLSAGELLALMRSTEALR